MGGIFYALYYLIMITTQDIMEAMLDTARHNIDNNSNQVSAYENECQAGNSMGELYLKQYASSVSRDVAKVDDLSELRTALTKQILGTTYMMRVCLGYLEEVERHQDAEIEEYLNQSDTDSL